MTKIKTSNITKGRPGFITRATSARFTGRRVSKNGVGVRGVRRLFAQNPADGKTANIGTSKDASFIQPNVNVNGHPNPRVVKAPKNVTASGIKKVVNRSTNRSRRISKS